MVCSKSQPLFLNNHESKINQPTSKYRTYYYLPVPALFFFVLKIQTLKKYKHTNSVEQFPCVSNAEPAASYYQVSHGSHREAQDVHSQIWQRG